MSPIETPETELHVARYFDGDAVRWWTLYDEATDPASLGFAYRMSAVLEDLRRECPASPSRVVLDVGCGTAPFLGALMSEPGQLAGIDIAPRMLELGKRRFEEAGRPSGLACGSATSLPLKDGSCSAVLAAGVIEYFERPAQVLSEMRRVLKPGGVAIVTAPYRWSVARTLGFPRTAALWLSPKTKLRIFSLLKALGSTRDPASLYLGAGFSRAEIRRMAAEAGLEVERTSLSGGPGPRIAGITVLSQRRTSKVMTWIEQRRHRFPWRRFGADLIIVLRAPRHAAR